MALSCLAGQVELILSSLSWSSSMWAGCLELWIFKAACRAGRAEWNMMECTLGGCKCLCLSPPLCTLMFWWVRVVWLCSLPFLFELAESHGQCRHLCGCHSCTCKPGDTPAQKSSWDMWPPSCCDGAAWWLQDTGLHHGALVTPLAQDLAVSPLA